LNSRDSEHEKGDPSVILVEELAIFNKIVTRGLHERKLPGNPETKSKPEIRQHLVTSPLDPSKPTEDEVNDPPQSQEKQDVPFPNAVRRTKSRITEETDVIVELCTEGIIERSSDPDPSPPQHSASAGSESTAVNKDSFYTRSHPDHR